MAGPQTVVVVVLAMHFAPSSAHASARGTGLGPLWSMDPEIGKEWIEVDPNESMPGFTYHGLAPSCAAPPPSVDPSTGNTVVHDPRFSFFVKGGTTNNVLLLFEGGGACWHPMNCLYARTYKEAVVPIDDIIAADEHPGILDTDHPDNVFRDWTLVYIPYCTADVHVGASDSAYQDIAGAYKGEPQTLRHRGFVNFQAVLHWLRLRLLAPYHVFVAGSSAGSYGASFAFPFVREAFPWSKVDLLGDAGIGVLGGTFAADATRWQPQMATWVPGLESGYTREFDFADYTRIIADYYPWSHIAQFTTAWDGVQTSFLHIMLNVTEPDTWESGWPSLWCDWNSGMLLNRARAEQAPNYSSYVAAGTYHTILTSSEFFRERSAGTPFHSWIRKMVQGYPWPEPWGLDSLCLPSPNCSDCGDPISCD